MQMTTFAVEVTINNRKKLVRRQQVMRNSFWVPTSSVLRGPGAAKAANQFLSNVGRVMSDYITSAFEEVDAGRRADK